MKIENMKELYKVLIRAASRGYKYRSIENPSIPFSNEARAGDYNYMTDEEYDIKINSIKELNRVWQNKASYTVGGLLLSALENIDLDEGDVEDIAATLMCAYEKSDQTYIPCDDENKKVKKSVQGGATNDKNVTAVPNKSRKDIDDLGIEDDEERQEQIQNILSSPSGIYDYLDKHVYGQVEAKKAASMLLWNHVNGRKQNLVFAGPTGSGKTEIFRQLSKLYPNIVVHNAALLSGTSWKGNMKVRHLFSCEKQEDMEHLIIVLDEADKMFEDVDDRRHYSYIVQNELLKLMEGDMVHFEGDSSSGDPTLNIDTSNVSFVFLGSFDSMVKAKGADNRRAIGFGAESGKNSFDGYNSLFSQEDLVEYANVRAEIAGRIDNIVQLQEMGEEDFYSILNSKDISPLKKLGDYYGVELKMSAKAKHSLAKEAADNKMGVRYMRSKLQHKLDELLFKDSEKQEYRINWTSR